MIMKLTAELKTYYTMFETEILSTVKPNKMVGITKNASDSTYHLSHQAVVLLTVM